MKKTIIPAKPMTPEMKRLIPLFQAATDPDEIKAIAAKLEIEYRKIFNY